MSASRRVNFQHAVKDSVVRGFLRSYHLVVRALFIFFLVLFVGGELYGLYIYAPSWYLPLVPIAIWGGNDLFIGGAQSSDVLQIVGSAFVSVAVIQLFTIGFAELLTNTDTSSATQILALALAIAFAFARLTQTHISPRLNFVAIPIFSLLAWRQLPKIKGL